MFVWWFPNRPEKKKWALNPSRPGALSGLKLSTTFSISSAVTCRINPSYWSDSLKLKIAVHIARSDLSQDVLEMINCSSLDASLPINHVAIIIFNGTQIRALLSDKAAHIVLVFLSPFFNHRTRYFCLIRDSSASSIALSSYHIVFEFHPSLLAHFLGPSQEWFGSRTAHL